MNTLLIIASLVSFATASHIGGGVDSAAVLTGPSGVVSNIGHGVAVGGLGLGLGWGNAGLGLGWGNAGLGAGWGHGGVIAAAPIAVAAAPVAVAAPAVAVGGWGGHGLGAITNGGGTIGVGAHGAAIRGPPTAPVVVAGPSGKIAADGLWGPTANIGLTGGHGKW